MNAEVDNNNSAVSIYRSPIPMKVATVAETEAAREARNALAKAERIVIVTKLRFMGDTVVATPFFRQLRQYCPHAKVSLLTATSAAVALENCPYLDHLIPMEKPNGRRLQATREVYRHLRSGKYDTAFVLNRSLDSAVICAMAGIRNRIGYVNEWRGPFLTMPIPYAFDRHEVESHLDMLRAIGLPARDDLPELWISEPERERARAILRENGWSDAKRPLIGIQAGANDPGIREWGAERFARVADTLASELGGTVVLMGGATEKETAAKVAGAMRSSHIDLVGKLKLREALSVIEQCGLWVGNDSGLLHSAVSLRVPSVGLFGPNKIVRWGYDTPRHRSLTVFPETPALNDEAIRKCLDAIPEALVLDTARLVYRANDSACTASQPPYYTVTNAQARLITTGRR